jgi:CheY-like chemotaxis protein
VKGIMTISTAAFLLPSRLALVVDPDAGAHDLYAAMLFPVVSDIEYAEDGREALAKAFRHLPNVVITESQLPFISGHALCSVLRSDPGTADVPIILVTRDADPVQIERAHACGADSVLIKPCQREAVLGAIARGRTRSSDVDGRAGETCAEPGLEQAVLSSQSTAERSRRSMVRAHQRFETTTPPAAPPPLRCPACDLPLQYARSHIGGVNEHCAEQWDYYACRSGCGPFQYRQRTRKLRRVQ